MARKHNPNDPAAAHLHNTAAPIPPGALVERSALLPGLRVRHDGWTRDRTQRFLDTLGHTGCVRDAARVARVSNVAGYRLKKRFSLFSAAWDDALARAQQGLIAIAYQRAVEGKETVIIRNGAEYERRIAPSDAMLGLLVKRGDMTNTAAPVLPEDERITIAEWNDRWRFDDAGAKYQEVPVDVQTTGFMIKIRALRDRMLEYARETGTCTHCGQPLTDEHVAYLENHSLAEFVAMGAVRMSQT